MKAASVSSACVAGLLVCAVAASAQSLGEVARREAERRKSIATPGKVYTDEDLRAEPAPAVSAPAPATTTGSSPAPADAGEAGEQLPPDQDPGNAAYWQRRLTTAREALSRAEAFAEALQSRINALSTDFVNRDDPIQRATIGADRDKALAELNRVRQEILQHEQEIAAIQNEGRRAGVPAGWLR